MKFKVGLVTNTTGSGGMKTHFEGLLIALQKNFMVVVFNENPYDKIDKQELESCDYVIRYGWRQDEPHDFSNAIFNFNIKSDKAKNILVVCFDATMLNENLINEINRNFGAIFYDSFFSKSRGELAGISSSKTLVIQPQILWKEFQKQERNSDEYKFLTVTNELFIIKGIDILLDSFLEAFNSSESVSITIKTNEKDQEQKLIQSFLRKFKEEKRSHQMKVVSHNIPHHLMPNLYQQYDCYVLASRTETFGLPAIEAAFCGLDIIMHTWGGMNDYSEIIKYKSIEGTIEQMPENTWRMNSQSNWFIPNKRNLIEHMRTAFKKNDTGNVEQSRIIQEFGLTSVLHKNLHEILC
ncbi:MAG: glycosyltransferase [Bacteroidetes bacterium]|nr:glycosyltransferase [Bacteroidota bacterium]